MKNIKLARVAVLFCLMIGLATALAVPAYAGSDSLPTGTGHFATVWEFLFTAFTIFGVNFILSGDNGVLIAVTVTALPKGRKLRALAVATVFSIVLQTVATFFAAKLLHFPFLHLAGGLFVLWISINLFRNSQSGNTSEDIQHRFWKIVWMIVIAEVTMSTDNILAVGAIAKGNLWLLLLGLAPSIALVMFASSSFSLLIDRFPAIIFVGAALLANIGGDMIMTDAFTVDVLRPGIVLRRSIQVAAAVAIVISGFVIQRRRPKMAITPQTGDETA